MKNYTYLFFTALIGCGDEINEKANSDTATNVSDPTEKTIDNDGDGVFSEDDCDDDNPDVSDSSNDADCDGISTEIDCDD